VVFTLFPALIELLKKMKDLVEQQGTLAWTSGLAKITDR